MDKQIESQKLLLKQYSERFLISDIVDDSISALRQDIKDINMLLFVSLVKYVFLMISSKNRDTRNLTIDTFIKYLADNRTFIEDDKSMSWVYNRALTVFSEKRRSSKKDLSRTLFLFKFDMMMLYNKLVEFNL